jgi:hypothetical protein
MPRKSAAALAVVTPIVDARPPVPDDMPEAQGLIWRRIVNRLPHDWFRAEHLDLLRAYVGHCAISETIARSIETFDPVWLAEAGGLERFDQLGRLLEREHKLMVTLARAMRITHSMQYEPRTAATRMRQNTQFGPIGMDGEVRPAPWEKHK